MKIKELREMLKILEDNYDISFTFESNTFKVIVNKTPLQFEHLNLGEHKVELVFKRLK